MRASTPTAPEVLRFLWWNVQNFAHFAEDRRREQRWPASTKEFDEKLRRVGDALAADAQRNGRAHLVGLGEVTRRAALALRDRVFPGYALHALDLDLDDHPASHQVAWLAAPEFGFQRQLDIDVPRMPLLTRRMGVLDLRRGDARVRFVACHWPAFAEASENRRRIADHVMQEVYNFLTAPTPALERRSVIILGDLNEEPFGLPESHLRAQRSRTLAASPLHYQDHQIERVRLYNCAWRMLGEHRPHGQDLAPDTIDAAGTCYYANERRWATFDHVIVSAGLLGSAPPRIDEGSVRVVALRPFAPDGDHPQRFASRGGTFVGVSDHLPVSGRVVLEE